MGPQGPAGLNGAALGLINRTTAAVTLPTTGVNQTVATLALTAGNFVVTGKLDIRRSTTGSVSVVCELLNGTTVLETASFFVSSTNWFTPIFMTPLQPTGAVTLSMVCRTTSSGVTVQNRSLSAIQLQTLTVQ